MASRTEIVKSFTFDAAHRLNGFPEGHIYGRLHGHSFRAEVAIAAPAPGPNGFVKDFGEIEAALKQVRGQLDHSYLNDFAGLDQPTLENLTAWLANRLRPDLPGLSRVSLYRDSCGEACHLTFDQA